MKLPAEYVEFIDSWWDRTDGGVTHIAKAAGFIHFSLSSKELGGRKRRVVTPRHHVVVFPVRERGRQKHQSALLTLRTVLEDEIPDVTHGSVANHLRFQRAHAAANGGNDKHIHPGSDEYVEFELLSRAHEAPSQQPLRIAGAVRVNEKTHRKESMRIDLSQCIPLIATDVVEDGEGQRRLIRNRWWICVETLRLVCAVNCLDCATLDEVGGEALEWAICLMDAMSPVNKVETLPEQNIDELTRFIEQKGGKASDGRRAAAAAERSAGALSSATSGCAAASEGKSRRRRGGKDKKAAKGPSSTDAACKAGSPAAVALSSGTSPAQASSTKPPALVPAVSSDISRGRSRQPGVDGAVSDCVSDEDALGALMGEYRCLQESSRRLEQDTKLAVIRDFLEVLDHMQGGSPLEGRALAAVVGKFEAKLRVLGLTKVETLGREFDPDLHSAEGDATGCTVVEELKSGWLLGDVLVRSAFVVVRACG